MANIKHIVVTATEEWPLTPLHINAKFKSIREWLTSVCQTEKPETTISEFCIRLSFRQSSHEYTLCLYGVNTSLDERHQTFTHIVFEPSCMFTRLPKQQYKSFTYEQMKGELASQLEDFTMTEIFLKSFLAKSNIRSINDGHLFWQKKQDVHTIKRDATLSLSITKH